jgi:hypothetical protein
LKPFTVVIDACRVGRGLGAILMQEDEDEVLHPVAYWSRGLSDAERRYSATELECTAMHNAIKHWDPYLQNGREFTVVTDHYALVYMVTKTGGDAHQRLARLCMDLQGYTCKVKHRSGDKNLLADAVSRLFRVNDIPPVLTVDELRDDFGPLTEEEKNKFEHFGTEQGFIIETIEEHRREMGQIMREQLQDRMNQMVTERRSGSTKPSRKQPKQEGDTTMASDDKMNKRESQFKISGLIFV